MENLSQQEAKVWHNEFKSTLRELGGWEHGPARISTDPDAYGLRIRTTDTDTALRIMDAAPEHLRDNFIFNIGETSIKAFELTSANRDINH